MERIWPDSFVEENNLAQHVSMLRKVLREKGDGQKFIETVPKRGYRFVADVRESLMAGGRPRRESTDKTRASRNERQQRSDKSFLKDVVIIGRAIDFKA